jgi:hypothetical protein
MPVIPLSTVIIKTGFPRGLLKFTSAPAYRVANTNQAALERIPHVMTKT